MTYKIIDMENFKPPLILFHFSPSNSEDETNNNIFLLNKKHLLEIKIHSTLITLDAYKLNSYHIIKNDFNYF